VCVSEREREGHTYAVRRRPFVHTGTPTRAHTCIPRQEHTDTERECVLVCLRTLRDESSEPLTILASSNCKHDTASTWPVYPDAHTQTGTEEQGRTQAQIGTEGHAHTQPQTQTGTEGHAHTQPQTQTGTEEHGHTQPQPHTGTEEQGRTQPQTQTGTEGHAHTQPQTHTGTEEHGHTQPQTEYKRVFEKSINTKHENACVRVRASVCSGPHRLPVHVCNCVRVWVCACVWVCAYRRSGRTDKCAQAGARGEAPHFNAVVRRACTPHPAAQTRT
jgi:hypothetical protein